MTSFSTMKGRWRVTKEGFTIVPQSDRHILPTRTTQRRESTSLNRFPVEHGGTMTHETSRTPNRETVILTIPYLSLYVISFRTKFHILLDP